MELAMTARTLPSLRHHRLSIPKTFSPKNLRFRPKQGLVYSGADWSSVTSSEETSGVIVSDKFEDETPLDEKEEIGYEGEVKQEEKEEISYEAESKEEEKEEIAYEAEVKEEEKEEIAYEAEVKEEEKEEIVEAEVKEEEKEEIAYKEEIISSDEESEKENLADDLLKELTLMFESEDKSKLLIYGTGALLTLWVSSIVISAIDSIPLFPKLMEAVGLGYTVWFSSRYLLFKQNRDELFGKIVDVKNQIVGSADE